MLRRATHHRSRLRHGLTAPVQRGARAVILKAVDSRRVESFVSRYGMRLGARRFVPAESLDELVPVFAAMTARGVRGVTGLFDDPGHDPDQVLAHEAEYRRQIDRIADEGLEANVGLKMTHLGVYLGGADGAYPSVHRLVEHAGTRGMLLRIDMEESELIDATLDVYRRLRSGGLDNVGVVLQSYLYRSEKDLEDLLPLGVNVRLVKGAYLEPASVAYQDKADVDAAYVRLLGRSLESAAFTAIATHDPVIVTEARRMIAELGLGADRYEFQMLFGIATQLQNSLIEQGEPLRIAAPYGPTWFPYLMRRLAERPANLGFFLRNAFR